MTDIWAEKRRRLHAKRCVICQTVKDAFDLASEMDLDPAIVTKRLEHPKKLPLCKGCLEKARTALWEKRKAQYFAWLETIPEADRPRLDPYRGRKTANPFTVVYRDRRMLEATPAWADFQHIKAIYKESKRIEQATGIAQHVDHIVPILGEDVCGLHVPWNLQILPASENMRKSNRFDETMAIAPPGYDCIAGSVLRAA